MTMPLTKLRCVAAFFFALVSCTSVTPPPRTPAPLAPIEMALVVPAGEALAYRVHAVVSDGTSPPHEQTQTYFLEHIAYEADVESPLVVRKGDTTNAEVQVRQYDSFEAFVRSTFPTPTRPVGETPIEDTWSPGRVSPWGPPVVFRDSFQLQGEERGQFQVLHRRPEAEGAGRLEGQYAWNPLGMYSQMQETMRTEHLNITIVKTIDRNASRERSEFLQRVVQARSDARSSFEIDAVPSSEAEVLAALSPLDEASVEILLFHLFGYPVRVLTQIAGLDEPLRRAFFESAAADRVRETHWPASMLMPLQNIAGDSPSASHFLETLPTHDLEVLRATTINDPELVPRVTQALSARESMMNPVALLEVLIEKLEAFPESSRGREMVATALFTFTYSHSVDVDVWRTYLAEHRDRPFVEWLLEVARGDLPKPAMMAMQELARALFFGVTEPSDAIREVAAAGARSDSAWVHLGAAELLLRLGDAQGIPLTIQSLAGTPQARMRAFTNLSIVAPSTFGFRPGGPELERAVALARIEAWAASL